MARYNQEDSDAAKPIDKVVPLIEAWVDVPTIQPWFVMGIHAGSGVNAAPMLKILQIIGFYRPKVAFATKKH
jgi:hypothetical protein